MKNDLETFPKAAFPISKMTSAELLDHILRLVNWKSSFKEELQEMKAKHSPKMMVNLHTILDDILGKRQPPLEEILGESENKP